MCARDQTEKCVSCHVFDTLVDRTSIVLAWREISRILRDDVVRFAGFRAAQTG